MTYGIAAASPIPIAEGRASPIPSSDNDASAQTYAASAKNENAMKRRAVFSRVSGSLAENCQATAAAEEISTTESSPKPMSADDDTLVPSLRATTASTML